MLAIDFNLFCPCGPSGHVVLCFAIWTQWRITTVLAHILDDELLCSTFLHETWTPVFLFLKKKNPLVIDDMWWNKLSKINDLCCCNEKDFFFFFGEAMLSFFSDGDVDELDERTTTPGQGDKYYAWLLLPPCLVTSWKAIVSLRRLDCKTCAISY